MAAPSAPGFYPAAVPLAYPGYYVPEDLPPNQPPEPPDVAAPGTMRDRWSIVVGPATGQQVMELATARARKVTFKLAEPSECSFTLDGADPAAPQIAELASDVHLFRRPAAGQPRELLFRGRIGNVSDAIDETSHTVTVPVLDYRAVLKRRHLLTGSQQTWTNTDQAAVAWGLITQAQNKTGGSHGIVNGASNTGVVRDRTYDLGDNIGERLQELSEVIDGFDFDITPTQAGTLTFQIWYPQRGTDRGVVLEVGGGATSVQRTVDSKEYANAIRVTGTQPEGGGAEPPPHERYAADLATAPQGRWDGVYGEDITTTANLAERADWRLAQQQVIRPTYTCKLRAGWWGGPTHIWLGDSVRLLIYRGRLAVDTTLRVNEIAVDIAEDSDEQVSLTLGGPQPDFRKRTAEVERRLSTLERR